MSHLRDAERRAWFREPLVWLVIGIPLSSVIMGAVIITVSIASDDGLVADDYYKRGLEINRVLARDQAAARAALSARLHVEAGSTRLELASGEPGYVLPESVTLALSYATRAGLDRELRLSRLASGDYEGPVMALDRGRWYVEVAAADWRLTGALQVPGSGDVRLRSATDPKP